MNIMEHTRAIQKLISTGNFISVNKTLMKCCGLNEAVVLGELISEQDYFEENNMLDEEGFFYITVAKLQDITTLSERSQRTTLSHLVDMQLVEIVYKGLPKKRHIKINIENILNMIEEYSTNSNKVTSNCVTQSLDTYQRSTNNNKVNNNKHINKVVVGQGKNSNTNIRHIYELSKEELEKLKQVVLENRDTRNITYKEIQKQFELIESVTYNTPDVCDMLIDRIKCEENLERRRLNNTPFSKEIF